MTGVSVVGCLTVFGGLQPGGLTTEEGIKGRSGNKSLLIPPLTRRSKQELLLEALSQEHGWIYDYVLRILDEQL